MTVLVATAYNPLNDPAAWLRTAAFDEPISPEEHERVQAEIDSIIGTTRDNKSIAKLVWNGDRSYWKEYFDSWDPYGQPIGELKRRPWLLYKSIFDGTTGKFIRDAFVPRYMLLTRLEPEQFADTWRATSQIYHPERKRRVQIKPETPPDVFYLWFRTIAEHKGDCCQINERNNPGGSCYGSYAHPRQCLDELRDIRRAMDERKLKEHCPFDSPDRVAARIRDNMTNNYAEQAMDRYIKQASFLLDEAPLAIADVGLIEEGASRYKIRNEVGEDLKRGQDALERELKRKGAI